jgi:hypothetical protein
VLVSKSDFSSYIAGWSTNIEEAQVNAHITNAELYDLRPKLTQALYTALSIPGVELTTFLDTYVKPALCLMAYARFLASHGRNISQFGLTELTDPQGTFNPLTEESRGVLIEQAKYDRSVRVTDMMNALEVANWTFDGTTYQETESVRKRKFGISGVRTIKQIQDGIN